MWTINKETYALLAQHTTTYGIPGKIYNDVAARDLTLIKGEFIIKLSKHSDCMIIRIIESEKHKAECFIDDDYEMVFNEPLDAVKQLIELINTPSWFFNPPLYTDAEKAIKLLLQTLFDESGACTKSAISQA